MLGRSVTVPKEQKLSHSPEVSLKITADVAIRGASIEIPRRRYPCFKDSSAMRLRQKITRPRAPSRHALGLVKFVQAKFLLDVLAD